MTARGHILSLEITIRPGAVDGELRMPWTGEADIVLLPASLGSPTHERRQKVGTLCFSMIPDHAVFFDPDLFDMIDNDCQETADFLPILMTLAGDPQVMLGDAVWEMQGVVMLKTVTVDKEWRKMRVGLAAVAGLIHRLGNYLYVGEPCPIADEGQAVLEGEALDKACEKLVHHWEKLGFKRCLHHKDYVYLAGCHSPVLQSVLDAKTIEDLNEMVFVAEDTESVSSRPSLIKRKTLPQIIGNDA